MPANSAEYQRRYRAKRKLGGEPTIAQEVAQEAPALVWTLQQRVAELEEEVRQLKRRLAEKPTPLVAPRISTLTRTHINPPPTTKAPPPSPPPPRAPFVVEFRPAPKPGKKS